MRMFLLFLVLILSGCARNNGPYVSIDALSSGKIVGKKYILVPANPELKNADQLYFSQVEGYVDRVLKEKGYQKVQDKNIADQAILIIYSNDGGVSSTRDEVVPIIGQTGVSSANTYGTVTPTYGGGGYFNTNTTYTPSYGVTGAYTRQVTDTFYSTSIRLESFDIPSLKNGQKISLWRLIASSTSTQYNDRRDLKMLLYISRPFIGDNLPERKSGFVNGDGKKMDAYFQ